jgi:hypothetical protein
MLRVAAHQLKVELAITYEIPKPIISNVSADEN